MESVSGGPRAISLEAIDTIWDAVFMCCQIMKYRLTLILLRDRDDFDLMFISLNLQAHTSTLTDKSTDLHGRPVSEPPHIYPHPYYCKGYW